MAQVTTKSNIEKLQLEAYRRMTGEERLRIGLGLHEASLAVAREGIRGQFPDADDETIDEKLRQRIRVGYEIQAAVQNRPSRPTPLRVNGEVGRRT